MVFDLNTDLNSSPAEEPPPSPDRGPAPARRTGGRRWVEQTRAAYVAAVVEGEENAEEERQEAQLMDHAVPEPLDFLQEVQMMGLQTRVNQYKMVEYGVRQFISFLKVDRGFDTVIRLEPATIFPFVSYLRNELKLAYNTSLKCCVAVHYWASNCPKIIAGDGTDEERIKDLKERFLYSQHYFERLLGVVRPEKTKPLMLAPFLKMLKCLDITRVVDLRDNVLLVLAYYMGARARELTNVRYKDIKILGEEQSILINMRPFKNSSADGSTCSFQFGAKTEKELNLVFLVRQLGLYCGAYNEDFSFTKDGGEMLVLATVNGDVVDTDVPLPSWYPTEIIKRAMKRCGIDPKHFALKSLRSGMASQLLLNMALLDGVGYIYNDWMVQYIEIAGHWNDSNCMRKTYISPVVDCARNNVAILFGHKPSVTVLSVPGVVESVTHEKSSRPEDIVKEILGGNQPSRKARLSRGKLTRVAEFNTEQKHGAEKKAIRAEKRKCQTKAASHPNLEIRRTSTSHVTLDVEIRTKRLRKMCNADNRRDMQALTRELKAINPKSFLRDVLDWAKKLSTEGDKLVKASFGKYTKALAELEHFDGTEDGRRVLDKMIENKTAVLYDQYTRWKQEQYTEMHDHNGNVMNRDNPKYSLKYLKPVLKLPASSDRQEFAKCKLFASKIYWKVPPRVVEDYAMIVKSIQVEIPDYLQDVVIPWIESPPEEDNMKKRRVTAFEKYKKKEGEYVSVRDEPKLGVGIFGPIQSSLQTNKCQAARIARNRQVAILCNLHVEWLILQHSTMFGEAGSTQECAIVMITPEDPASSQTAEEVGAPEGETESVPDPPPRRPSKRPRTATIDPAYQGVTSPSMPVVVPDNMYNGGNSLGPHRSRLVAKRDYEHAYCLEDRFKIVGFPFIEPKKAPFHVVLSYFNASLAGMALDLRGKKSHAILYDIKFHQMSIEDQKVIIDARRDKEKEVREDALVKKLCLLESVAAKLYHHQTYLQLTGQSPHEVPFPVSPESIKTFMWWMATDAVEPPESWDGPKKAVWRMAGPRMHTFTYVEDISGKLISYISLKEKEKDQKDKFAKNGDIPSLQAVVVKELEQIKLKKGTDRSFRQTPLPLMAIRGMISWMDPESVSDWVLQLSLLLGFTCLLRPNSLQLLKFRHLKFIPTEINGSLVMEIEVSVPDSKAVAYSASTGGLNRVVRLCENEEPGLCVVTSIVAMGAKVDLFVGGFEQACQTCIFEVKAECLDFFVLPAVEGGVLTPTKTLPSFEKLFLMRENMTNHSAPEPFRFEKEDVMRFGLRSLRSGGAGQALISFADMAGGVPKTEHFEMTGRMLGHCNVSRKTLKCYIEPLTNLVMDASAVMVGVEEGAVGGHADMDKRIALLPSYEKFPPANAGGRNVDDVNRGIPGKPNRLPPGIFMKVESVLRVVTTKALRSAAIADARRKTVLFHLNPGSYSVENVAAVRVKRKTECHVYFLLRRKEVKKALRASEFYHQIQKLAPSVLMAHCPHICSKILPELRLFFPPEVFNVMNFLDEVERTREEASIQGRTLKRILKHLENARLCLVKRGEFLKWDTRREHVHHLEVGDYKRMYAISNGLPWLSSNTIAEDDLRRPLTLPYHVELGELLASIEVEDGVANQDTVGNLTKLDNLMDSISPTSTGSDLIMVDPMQSDATKAAILAEVLEEEDGYDSEEAIEGDVNDYADEDEDDCDDGDEEDGL